MPKRPPSREEIAERLSRKANQARAKAQASAATALERIAKSRAAQARHGEQAKEAIAGARALVASVRERIEERTSQLRGSAPERRIPQGAPRPPPPSRPPSRGR
jgi:hypothetical protein